METLTITHESDARGSFCPGPLMELIRLVRTANLGDVVAVISSDEGSKKDIPIWIAKALQDYLGAEDAGGATRFICRKIR
jgi:TusA-related sulfurtransferase